MEPTHKINLHLDISVSMIGGTRPEELLLAVEKYVLGLSPSLEGGPSTWGMLKSGKGDVAKMTEPMKVSGVVVRDAQGSALVQSGSAIPDES